MALPRLNFDLEPDFTIPKIKIPRLCEHKVLVLKKNNEPFFNFTDKTYKCLECNQIFYVNTTNNIKMIKN